MLRNSEGERRTRPRRRQRLPGVRPGVWAAVLSGVNSGRQSEPPRAGETSGWQVTGSEQRRGPPGSWERWALLSPAARGSGPVRLPTPWPCHLGTAHGPPLCAQPEKGVQDPTLMRVLRGLNRLKKSVSQVPGKP